MNKPFETGKTVEDEGNGLTRTLRVLSAKSTQTLDPANDDPSRKHALLVCTDKSSEKWGPRWLGQSGFDVTVAAGVEQALEILGNGTMDVVVVEAWARTARGMRLFEEIQASPDIEVPVIALCNTTQDVTDAIDAGVYDIARKPFDWQLLSRRASVLLRQRRLDRENEELRHSLNEALDVANRARRQLRRNETFEPVTGLPNRAKFIELIGKGMRAAKRDGNCLAVAVVGFSRFRMILEALGRNETNAVFGEIGNRLNGCVRTAVDAHSGLVGLRTAAVGIIGDGRFGIMLTCSREFVETQILCNEIERSLAVPAVVSGQTVFLSTSTGVAIYPQDADDSESLLIRAESALREAKSRGASRHFFCSDHEAAAARRLKIEQKLYEAIDKRELCLAYQPINDVMTNRILASEALLRWPQKEGGFIGPDEFVPIAEDAGLMNRLGDFVFEEACRQLKVWQRAGYDEISMAINVSRSQLTNPNLPDLVARQLHDLKLRPNLIDIEISERGVLSGNEDAIRQLYQLKSLGVRLSVDDFGTGDSSIAYLKEMPVDTLKIDQSYIAHLETEERESRMIAAMIALAQKLELSVVAEGVETAAQLRILQSLGCDRYQGFLYSPAVPAKELHALAMSSRSAPQSI